MTLLARLAGSRGSLPGRDASPPLVINTNPDKTVEALLEDYRSHWQELLNFENENNRWLSLYVTALIFVIGWVLGNSALRSVPDLLDGRDGWNAYLVLSLPLLNAYYILAIALKGYQVQQLGLYLYACVGADVTSLSSRRFNTWDEWRRVEFQSATRIGQPELARAFYYGMISVLPFLVSCFFLGVYADYQLSDWWLRGGANVFFAVVCLVNLLAILGSLSTVRANHLWVSAINLRRTAERDVVTKTIAVGGGQNK